MVIVEDGTRGPCRSGGTTSRRRSAIYGRGEPPSTTVVSHHRMGATPPLQSTYLLRLRCAGAPAGISRASRLRRGAACNKPSSYRNSKSPYGTQPRWKRRDSRYEPGLRSGAWRKIRINQGQEFVIGGYTPSVRSFDSLIFGYHDGDRRLYTARTRNGFTPRSCVDLFNRLRTLETSTCPFANLPEAKSGRWGAGLTAEKMRECRCVQPEVVGQFEFLEWTADDHLRHSRFVALREDKRPRDVTRER